jgi:site-specific DNA-cytosine methylase
MRRLKVFFSTEDEGQFATPDASTNDLPAKPASRSTKKRALKKPAAKPMADASGDAEDDAFLTTDEEPCAKATKKRALKKPAAKLMADASGDAENDAFLTTDEEPCAKAVAKNKARAKAKGAAKKTSSSSGQSRSADEPESNEFHTEDELPPAAAPRSKKAKAKAKPAARESKRLHPEVADANDPPEASGVFAYAHWLALHKLSEHEVNSLGAKELRVGSVCSGMSTETVALEALKRVAPPFRYDVKLLCELKPTKLKFLRKLHPAAHLAKDVRGLQRQSDLIGRGSPATRPLCEVLFAGISCKSVSGLNVTPESVLSLGGSTGQTLSGLHGFVGATPFELRPKVILLENVAALAKQRAVEGHKVATTLIKDIFDPLGYSCDWATVSAKDFYVPQNRERVWMIFLKRPSLTTSDAALEETAAKLRATLQTVRRFMVPSPEPLSKLLRRLGPTAFAKAMAWPRRAKRPLSAKTREDLKKYAKEKKLTLRQADADAFKRTVGTVFSHRATDSCYAKMLEARKKHGWDWTCDTLVLSAGQSIEFMQCCEEIFPTITPTGAFLVLEDGEAHRPSGKLSLALQGVQQSEATFMGMDSLSDTLQQDFAGNGFTANVCLAFLLAVLLSTDG